MKRLTDFTNLYSLSKTLRFELIPQGKTLENIKLKGLIHQDEQRANSYKLMKKTLDEYHKWFIETSLSEIVLHDLDIFQTEYLKNKEQRDQKKFDKLKEGLRKQIANAFKANPIFSLLDKDDLFKGSKGAKGLIETWLDQNESIYENIFKSSGNKETIEEIKSNVKYGFQEFKTFTTYFGGFHENRKNIYSEKEQNTAIAFRLVHENLPKFIDNLKAYQSLKSREIDIADIDHKMTALLNGHKLEELFSLEFYNKLLTQKGIDFYNTVLGGKSTEDKQKVQGLNEHVNQLINQKSSSKSEKIKFKQLYKQILSDRESLSFIPDKLENDGEVYDTINQFYRSNLLSFERNGNPCNVLDELKIVTETLKEYNLSRIYLRRDSGFTSISQTMYGDYSIFDRAISEYYEKFIDPKFREKYEKRNISDTTRKKLDDTKKSWNKAYISITQLQECLDEYVKDKDNTDELFSKIAKQKIADYFKEFNTVDEIKDNGNKKQYTFQSHISEKYKAVEGLLNINKEQDTSKSLVKTKSKAVPLKEFLDAILNYMWFLKPLMYKGDTGLDKESDFYNNFTELYESLEKISIVYDKVRNYVAQKSYSIQKFKLNFENVQLLNGWDENKQVDYLSVILRNDNIYYLAIINKNDNRCIENLNREKPGRESYEKMVYKLLPGANKMLPKVFFSASRFEYFNPSENILRIRNTASHSKNGEPQEGYKKADFNLKDCHALIDFFKESIAKHEDWSKFNFKFTDTHYYTDISGFYREVESQGYKIYFENLSKKEVDLLIEEGKIYLFKIYNKDFSEFSKGKPNLHTMYWKALFDPENLKNVVYKLNGEAEMFYRPASISQDEKIVHPKNHLLKSKNLHRNKESTFSYEIIKDKRFTEDKFQFHVPITLNFKANGNERINDKTLAFVRNNPVVNIIGLDRGERNLIYLTRIDREGRVLQQESLNFIPSDKFEGGTNYHALLHQKEVKRGEARKEWGEIENIKELKAGYLSQIVHKIAKMMVKYNAIVVMEDLNFGFKRGRFKVEKQIYQKFEKMMIDKLNYLVFKEMPPNEPGGVLKAMQLTSKFTSFKELGKQSGFLFYVPAWNTSKIDPTTGFTDMLRPKYESKSQVQDFVSRFRSIYYDQPAKAFVFSFDYKDFPNTIHGIKTDWHVFIDDQERYHYDKSLNNNKGDYIKINVVQAMEDLLGKFNIDYGGGKNLKQDFINADNTEFYKKIIKLLSITLQLRYNNGKKGSEEKDYILSPVKNSSGLFFNSLNATDHQPKDADANGAYHIAKKGLLLLSQINNPETDLNKPVLNITNQSWLEFVQSHPLI